MAGITDFREALERYDDQARRMRGVVVIPTLVPSDRVNRQVSIDMVVNVRRPRERRPSPRRWPAFAST